MLFNSASFLLFFPLVTLGYFLLPHRWRWLWLLLASCVFYMAFIPIYILILLFTILVDYYAGLLIERSQGGARRAWLGASLVANLGVLALFKYCNFFISNWNAVAAFLHWNLGLETLEIILPIGLSFHTFQAMSYTIEVFRGHHPAERHLGHYALYVMFYPQLVAGPIERPEHLLPQFREVHAFDYERVTDGLKLMGWGLFKKVVIADRLATVVNLVYLRPDLHGGPLLLLATLFFAYQIYCDFSGYSDIALGAAQVMGFRLRQNFNQPYHARTMPEFWRRWHISLSTWFRDYLYISLGGSRVNRWRWYFNLWVTFLVSGFWHGANWTFVIWGALHGFYLVFGRVTESGRARFRQFLGLTRFPRLLALFQVLTVFSLVTVGWIFFRATTLADARYILTHLFSGYGALGQPGGLGTFVDSVGLAPRNLCVALLSLVGLETIHLLQRLGRVRPLLARQPAWVRWSLYYGTILGIVLFGVFDESHFIYFQF